MSESHHRNSNKSKKLVSWNRKKPKAAVKNLSFNSGKKAGAPTAKNALEKSTEVGFVIGLLALAANVVKHVTEIFNKTAESSSGLLSLVVLALVGILFFIGIFRQNRKKWLRILSVFFSLLLLFYIGVLGINNIFRFQPLPQPLCGYLADGENGMPIAKAKLKVLSPKGELRSLPRPWNSDPDGKFVITGNEKFSRDDLLEIQISLKKDDGSYQTQIYHIPLMMPLGQTRQIIREDIITGKSLLVLYTLQDCSIPYER